MLRPCSEQHREGCIKPRLPLGCRPPAYMGGRLVAGLGVECPLSAPSLGNAAAPSHFPLGPLLAFQAAAFSIVNLETENKPVGRGGSREVTGAAARLKLAAVKPRPHKPRPPMVPPLPLCPAQAEIWGPLALTLERVWQKALLGQRLSRGGIQGHIPLQRSSAQCQPPVSPGEPEPCSGFVPGDPYPQAAASGIIGPV